MNRNQGFLHNIGLIDPHLPLLCVFSGGHAGGSMTTTNHVVGIWKTQVLDVESAHSYPLCIENLDFTCGTEVQFNEMTYGIALIPSKYYSVAMAYHNSVHLMTTSDLVPSEFVVINNRRKRKRKKSNKT